MTAVIEVEDALLKLAAAYLTALVPTKLTEVIVGEKLLPVIVIVVPDALDVAGEIEERTGGESIVFHVFSPVLCCNFPIVEL